MMENEGQCPLNGIILKNTKVGEELLLNGHIFPENRKPQIIKIKQNSETHIEAPCCRDIHGYEPPDGGMRAWLVMLSAFICNGVIFGIINTYGVIHALLTDRLTEQGDSEASSKAALVGSLTIGTTFLLSPVAGCLTDKIGLRRTTLLGGILSVGGLFLSSFSTENIDILYLTYGVMFGLGAALAYTPTLAILGHYFKRYLGKVSGFVTAGSSVFTVILPPGLDYLLKRYGIEITLQFMSLISFFIIVCSFVYKPLQPPPEPQRKKPGCSRANILLRSIINVDIWKCKKYVIWALCVPMALFGYFVPYVHMMKFVQNNFPGNGENLPVMCIGVTSGIGRLIFGAVADIPGVNRIYLQQLSLISIGVVTILLPLTTSYIILIAFTLIMGLFDGCFISLLGPIAYQICGPTGATQAIGFLLGLSSIPLTVGPPIAGKIYDSTGSYTTPFILAGVPPIVGACIMFLIRCVSNDNSNQKLNALVSTVKDTDDDDNEQNLSIPNVIWINKDSTLAASLLYEQTTNNSTLPDAEINGTSSLASTGISSPPTFVRISAALEKFENSIACRSSDNTLLTNNPLCPKAALLNNGYASTLVVNNELGSSCMLNNKLETADSSNLLEKRRYAYSIY